MDTFSVLLLNVSEKLNDKELDDMKFLCQKKIVKKKMETISSPIHLFQQLKELVEISEDDVAFLIELLSTIKRQDLVLEVERYRGGRGAGGERDNLDEAFDIICDNVGKDWKRLIRTLGVTDNTIDQVVNSNPYNMREQLFQCLREWRTKKKDKATVSALVEALDKCRLRLVSERLVEAINLNHGSS
ncbi:FAS-associated death domain protein [Engystomops pustulosus]|uniref:FAS-associated death domain protein n=1 Tax=Engystomops pustulosus TaxID=76066 RepID=UPI003AFB76DF